MSDMDILDELWNSDAANSLTNRAAREMERLRAEVASLTQQLAAANGRVEMLREALAEIERLQRDAEQMRSAIERAINLIPANDGNGGLIYDHYSPDGEYVGTEQVDPMWVIQGMQETLSAAIAASKGQGTDNGEGVNHE